MTFIQIFEYYSFPQSYWSKYSFQTFDEQYSNILIIRIFIKTLYLAQRSVQHHHQVSHKIHPRNFLWKTTDRMNYVLQLAVGL